MHKDLESVCTSLDAVATAVLSGWGSDATFTDSFGWFAPTLTRHDLAGMARSLAADIRSTASDTIDEAIKPLVIDLPRRLQILQANTVPQMYGANAGQAVPAYTSTIAFVRGALLPPLAWQALSDVKALPTSLARRARAALAELDQLTPSIANLAQQITDIQSAHAVAESLPIDLQALSEAREKLDKAATDSAILAGKIKDAHGASSEDLSKMNKAYIEAEKLVAQCETAYHITTTKGLAGAFDQRAVKLSQSMWTWVIGLIGALSIGSLIGAGRLDQLSIALNAPSPNMSSVGIQALLSLVSIGAPLWFAWLATKQIGQRFRLAEDYAFKASVAKAYEGYRKEAARIDPAFEAQLFSSALTRLDEPPLRLVETSNHGSPWHELANSEGVRSAFRAAPELQEKVSALLREGMATVGKVLTKNEPTPKKEELPAA